MTGEEAQTDPQGESDVSAAIPFRVFRVFRVLHRRFEVKRGAIGRGSALVGRAHHMLKADLHLHSSEDPYDILDYDARDLIRHAAKLQFDVIAITLHGKVIADPGLQQFASDLGVLFIPGIEKRIHGKEILIYNVTQAQMDAVRTFPDLRELKRQMGDEMLVIAPHPFFRRSQCLGRHLEENIDVFDAIEYCHLYTRFWNLNKRAVRVAREHHKPMVATSDSHALWMFGNNYTLLDVPKTMAGVFRGVREGLGKPHSEPIKMMECVKKMGWFFTVHKFRKMKRLARGASFAPAVVQSGG
jgi:predicted metal-dependent phosphoesterase TrpH